MFRLIVNLTTRVRWFLRCYAPSNITLDAIRTRRGHKWGVPAALVLVPAHLYAASFTTTLIEHGGPGWLNLVVLTLVWSALKFAVMAPVSVRLLIRACLAERSSPSAPAVRPDGLRTRPGSWPLDDHGLSITTTKRPGISRAASYVDKTSAPDRVLRDDSQTA